MLKKFQDPPANAAKGDADHASPRHERAALATTASAHFLHDAIADSLYVLLPLWAQAFGLNYTQVGSLKMAYSAAMAVFQMPAGLAAERYGERVLLVAGTMLTGAAFASMAASPGYIGLFCIILVVGLGSAVQHPLASSIIARGYSPDRRRSALGIYNFFGDVGKMVVSFGVAAVAGLVGWQVAVVGYGALVAVASLPLLVVLAHFALGAKHATSRTPSAASVVTSSKDWGVTNARGFTLLSSIHVIDSASRTGTLTLLPFVLIGKGASPSTVGVALACIFAGGAVGKLACGLLADRMGILRTLILTEVATAGILMAAVLAPLAPTMFLMPLLGIALNGTSSVLYRSVTDFVRPDRQARVFGLFYTLGSIAGGSAPLIFGLASDAFGLTHALLALAAIVLVTIPLAIMMRGEFSSADAPVEK